MELGLQTVKEESVRFIRRAYDTPVYDRAVRELKARGIYVVTHIILGLPGETVEDMAATLSHAVACGTDGVKLQLLHILKDSDLYPLWLQGEAPVLSMEEYIDILAALLPLLPENVAVHRLTGDGDKKTLVAPLWSADKKAVLNAIRKR